MRILYRLIPVGCWIFASLILQGCSGYFDSINPGENPPNHTATPSIIPTEPGATLTQVSSPTPTRELEEILLTPIGSTPTPPIIPTRESPNTDANSSVIFSLQAGTPSYLPNTFHQELGCSWLGVAGQVFDAHGQPISGLILEVSGEFGGKQVLELGISGGAPQYGVGGYEIVLADVPKESLGTLVLRLLDLDSKILSGDIKFDTYASCEKNLIIINFVGEDFFVSQNYLPAVWK